MKNLFRLLAVLALCVGTAFAQNQSGPVNSGGSVSPSPATGGPAVFTTLGLADGTAPIPSLYFSADTNTGIFRPATDTFGISAGGVDSAWFTSTAWQGLNSLTGGLQLNNQADVTTAYERVEERWIANVFTIQTVAGVGGTQRNLSVGSASTTAVFDGTTNGGITLTPSGTGNVTFAGAVVATSSVRTSGVAPYLTVNAPADTGRTAATESTGVNFVGATRTWADGTVATQREFLVQAPTYNKTTTSATFTHAATFSVSAAPIAGAGVTITNPHAILIGSGRLTLNSAGGTTSADGLWFGTDVNIFRTAANALRLATNGASMIDVGTTLVDVGSGVGSTTILRSNGSIVSNSATSGVGYTTGAGGTVTQATDKTTGVTLSKVTGQITMNAANLNAGTSVGFTVTNTAVATTDVVIVNIDSGATLNAYTITVDAVGAGSFHIHLRNESAGALAEAVVINFAVIKAVTS